MTKRRRGRARGPGRDVRLTSLAAGQVLLLSCAALGQSRQIPAAGQLGLDMHS